MGGLEMEYLCEKWESMGLQGLVEKDGLQKWEDFCVYEGLFGGATRTCDWLDYDPKTRAVFMKSKPPGKIKAPKRN
jgi:hypothetical protein